MSIYYGYKDGYAVHRRASLDTVSAVSAGACSGSFPRLGSFGGSFYGSYGGSWHGSFGGSFTYGSFAYGSFAAFAVFGSFGSLAGLSGSFKGSGISGSFAAPSESGMPEVILGYGINLI